MLFTEARFAVFMVTVFLVSWLLVFRTNLRKLFLALAGILFYMCWSPKYVLLLVGAMVLDFVCGLQMVRFSPGTWQRRAWIAASLTGNLGMLFTFKYYGSAGTSLEILAGWAGVDLSLPAAHLVLPVGISFFTFQTMSHTLDVYFRRIQPTRSFLDFATFVAFFPQLLAGPIVRASVFLPQLGRRPSLDGDTAGRAVYRTLLGLAKKVAVADFIGASLVDRVFESPDMFSSLEVLLACYGYTLQIYCDFSG